MTFTPRATTGVRPPTDPSVAAQPLLQHFYTQVLISSTKNQKTPKKTSGVNVSFLPVALLLLAALFWLKSGLIKDNPLLSCGQIILTPI